MVDFDYDPRDQRIVFTAETQYEVVDAFGTVVLQGHGKEVILRYLARGEYFVNYGARSRPSRSAESPALGPTIFQSLRHAQFSRHDGL